MARANHNLFIPRNLAMNLRSYKFDLYSIVRVKKFIKFLLANIHKRLRKKSRFGKRKRFSNLYVRRLLNEQLLASGYRPLEFKNNRSVIRNKKSQKIRGLYNKYKVSTLYNNRSRVRGFYRLGKFAGKLVVSHNYINKYFLSDDQKVPFKYYLKNIYSSNVKICNTNLNNHIRNINNN